MLLCTRVSDDPPDDADTPTETAASHDPEGVDAVDLHIHEHSHDARNDELDGLRIRQLAALKRGAYRARSFAIIGAVTCFVVAVKLALMTVNHVQARGWGPWPIGFALFSLVALMAGSHFSRRALDVHREINTPAPLPPTPEGGPDFSTLSDGSQQWKNLEDIR